MKKLLITLIICTSTIALKAQFGVSYHQTAHPFVGFNYEFVDRFLPELRFGMNNQIDHMSVEAVATFQFIDREEVEVYAGLGGRANNSPGLVAPIGIHAFPFTKKNFGFHFEVCPIISEHRDSPHIRGSWGIRYRFKE